MHGSDLKKISRITAILTQLQSKKILTATYLAGKFQISKRTIYRDLKTLEEAGVPIISENGKGFSIMDGYRIPPVMFTEKEALALITGDSIISKQKDASFRNEFGNAITKIKSVLRSSTLLDIESLEKGMFVGKNFEDFVTSSSLMDIQMAIVGNKTIKLNYVSTNGQLSTRFIEPYLLYYNDDDNWVLVAFCTNKKAFRSFRLDRINHFTIQDESFKPNTKAFKNHITKKYLS